MDMLHMLHMIIILCQRRHRQFVYASSLASFSIWAYTMYASVVYLDSSMTAIHDFKEFYRDNLQSIPHTLKGRHSIKIYRSISISTYSLSLD